MRNKNNEGGTLSVCSRSKDKSRFTSKWTKFSVVDENKELCAKFITGKELYLKILHQIIVSSATMQLRTRIATLFNGIFNCFVYGGNSTKHLKESKGMTKLKKKKYSAQSAPLSKVENIV